MKEGEICTQKPYVGQRETPKALERIPLEREGEWQCRLVIREKRNGESKQEKLYTDQ